MIVVSDTSPLNYLVLIELQDLLPQLFGRILIPRAVDRELRSPAKPDAIKRFVATPRDPHTEEHTPEGRQLHDAAFNKGLY